MNIDQAIDIIIERGGVICNSKNPIWTEFFINPDGKPQFKYPEDILNGISVLDDNWDVSTENDRNIIKGDNRGNNLSLFEALIACKNGERVYNELCTHSQRLIYRPDEPRSGGFICQYNAAYNEIACYIQEWPAIFTPNDVYYKTWRVV